MKKPKSSNLNVRILDRTMEELKTIADEMELNVSDIVRKSIDDFIDNYIEAKRIDRIDK